jgi:hypothetical protein
MSNYLINNNGLGVWNEMPEELYVIGDIHGDFFALKQSLELTGCVTFNPYIDEFNINNNGQYYYLDDGCEYYKVEKNNIRWNEEKKNSFIVFAGDLIDRCRPHDMVNQNCINTINDENCDYLILKLLYDLDLQARKYNSRVIVVLGNHEILNIQNKTDYASRKGRKDDNRVMNIKNFFKLNILNVYGIVRINNYIITHGGINDKYFIEFNKTKKKTYYESIEEFNQILRYFIVTGEETNNLSSYESPFWDRTIGGRDVIGDGQCENIFENNVLQINNFNEIKNSLKIIVAHCPQFAVFKNINLVHCQDYHNRVYRIDIGMSRAFDLYDLNKIKQILNDSNYENIIMNMYYKDFFMNDQTTENRGVSCLQLLKNNQENIIRGILTIDYFYSMEMFKDNKVKLKNILSDLKKIFIDNYNENFNPIEQDVYLNYIEKLTKLLVEFSK